MIPKSKTWKYKVVHLEKTKDCEFQISSVVEAQGPFVPSRPASLHLK